MIFRTISRHRMRDPGRWSRKGTALLQFKMGLLLLLVMFLMGCVEANAGTHKPILIAQGLPAAPTFSPAYGLYTTNTYGVVSPNVSISAAAGSIYYTRDGSQPTSSSTLYTGNFAVYSNTQVNAIAVVSGTASPVASAWYVVDYNAEAVSTTNMLLWLRGDFGPVLTSGNVTRWGDISLSENDATASSPNQPTVQPSSINGLASVTFVPGTSGQFLSVPAAVTNFSSGLSAFIVAKPNTLTSGAQLISLGASGGLANSIGFSENSTYEPTFSVYDSGGSATTVSSSTAFSTSQFHLYEAVQSGTTATLYVDGQQVAQNSSMNSLPSASFSSDFIGQLTTGGSYYSGQIAEIVLYNTAITQPQRSALEAYLMQKYQFTQQPGAPVLSVASGTLPAPTQVAISAPGAEAIYFTTDGSDPTTASLVYNGPISVIYSETIKAIGVSGAQQSTVRSASYVLDSSLYPAPSSGGVSLQINLTQPSMAIP